MLLPAAKRASCTRTDADADEGVCFPYDVLLDILRRLPCRAIAQSRTVCHEWRAIVDANSILPRFFTSRSFAGVFTNCTGCRDRSYFLAAPVASRSRAGDFRRPLFCHGWAHVKDHCNGLLLLHNDGIRPYGGREANDTYYVCNPATVRCDALPCPRGTLRRDLSEAGTFLTFDPAVSLHYEVYKVFRYYKTKTLGFEEPEATVVYSRVYSSRTRQWKLRQFVPGSCTAGPHLYTVKARARDMNWPSAEYWRGSLYVAGSNGILMILHCFDGTYDLVPLPGVVYVTAGPTYHLPRRSILASYEKGVHYAELSTFQLKVWAINKGLGDGQLGWTLLHDANLEPHIKSMQRKSPTITQSRLEWEMVRSSKSNGLFRQMDDGTPAGADDEEVQEQETYCDGKNNSGVEEGDNAAEGGPEYLWNSDEDNFIDVDETATKNTSLKWISFCGIIGLHPYKDALLLNISGTAVAYHFNTSRMQYLCHRLHSDSAGPSCAIEGAFSYRPCYDDVLPTRKIPCPPSVLHWWKQKYCANYNFLDFFKKTWA